MKVYPIVLTCIKCMRETRDWEEFTMCNIHYDEPTYTFDCLRCGNSTLVAATIFKTPTKVLSAKQKKLILEKRKIIKELEGVDRV